jgi:hypothetical protein
MKRPYFDEVDRRMMRDDKSTVGALLKFKLARMILFREIIDSLKFWKK